MLLEIFTKAMNSLLHKIFQGLNFLGA